MRICPLAMFILLLILASDTSRANRLEATVDQVAESLQIVVEPDSEIANAGSSLIKANPVEWFGKWVYGALVTGYEYLEGMLSRIWKRFETAYRRMIERRSKSGAILRVPLSGSD